MKNLKYIFLLVLALIFTKTNSQENNLFVKYDVVYNTTREVKRTAYLWANNNEAIYELDILNALSKESEQEQKLQKDQNTENRVHTIKANIKDNIYMRTVAKSNSLYYYEHLQRGQLVLIHDPYPQKWNITNETKKINDFLCYKATVFFRGVEWVVWFAPSISYPYGPWKLRGLPGLIMEAHDVNYRYNYSVKTIELKKEQGLLNQKFNELVSENIYNEMNIVDFVNSKDEILQSLKSSVTSRGGSIESTFYDDKVRYGRELIYEWEEEAKKK